MNELNDLIEAMARNIPLLNAQPLRDRPPASAEQLDILQWLADHLEAQGLIVYEEWKEYWGGVPALRSLAEIDLSGFDQDFVVDLMQHIDWSTASVDPLMLPYELPFLEHVNSALQPHGLRLVDLLPFENAYILCVKDDEEELMQLDRCLGVFGIRINLRAALDDQGARAHVEALLAA